VRKKGYRLVFLGLVIGLGLLLAIEYKELVYTRLYPVFRSLEGYRLNHLPTYQIQEYNGFRIQHVEEDQEYMADLEKAITAYSSSVFDFFDYQPKRTIKMIVYKDRESLNEALRLEDQNTMGAFYGDTLNLLSPNAWTSPGRSHIAMLDNVFVHELTHLVVDDIARGNFPLWFTEGSALYLEYRLLGYEWGKELASMDYFSMEDLEKRFQSLDDDLAYRQSFVLVKAIVEQYGREKYLELLNELGRGVPFYDALEKILGIKSHNVEKLLVP